MRALRSRRPLLLVVLFVCLALAGSAVRPEHLLSQANAPADPLPQALAAIAHGQRDEAERIASARGGNAAAVIRAVLATHRGQYKDAEELLEPAVSKERTGEAALELALVYREVGRAGDAAPLLNAIAQRGAGSSDRTTLLRAARAAHALGLPRDAKSFYLDAERAGADVASVETNLGRLFLEKSNPPEALKSFQEAIKADPRWAPAHAGMARVLQDEDPPAAAAAATKALEIDSELSDARLLLASLSLDDDKDSDARAQLEKVLAINPSNLGAHAMLGAMAYVRDDKATFDREVSTALQINPSYGEIYRVAGEQAAAHYRFEEAVALAQKAVDLDPTNSRAAADLGMHLMRTGDEAGARRTLDRAFRSDPYDRVTYNLLTLLDTLDQFTVVKDGDLVFKMQRDEEPVLREYAIPLAQNALKVLSARYQFTPSGPILIELFPSHDDFAVRTLGLPGMLGALGACFGKVVTADTPKARAPGTFAWQATLWHELAHVVTLQLSKQRIPRWLTEGISVYEEGRARPEWGRDMEVAFAEAMNKNKVLKLRDLNAGFTRPETIALAYYEASLLVDHIVQTKGQGPLNALVKTYADGVDTDTALKRALNVSIDDLQKTFDAALDARFGAMRRALADAGTPVDAASVDLLRTNAAAKPGSYVAQVAYGQALAEAGDAAAYGPLERAAALVPDAIGPESPHALMGALAEKLGDKARAIKEYEALVAVDHTNVDAARKLGDLAQSAKDARVERIALDRVVALDPFDANAHTAVGKLAMAGRESDVAVREFRAALAAGATDKASAHCDLGEAYLVAGKPVDAKKEALAALEIAPTYERAQDLLLKVVERKS
jgi:tetratricopeptide (TPR) repeat protein